MDWIVTTARTVEEAQTRALDLLGVDSADAEIQVMQEAKTGLFGRTKTEARVRARIKPKAPPAKEERRPSRGGDRNRNRGKGGGGGNNRGGQRQGNKGGGGNNRGGNRDGGNNRGGRDGNRGGSRDGNGGGNNRGGNRDGGNNRGGNRSEVAAGAAASGGGGGRNRNRGGGRDNRRSGNGGRNNEDRVEMPVEEQRETLEAFVTGVATAFDSTAKVTLVEEGTTLQAQVHGDDLGRLLGKKAATLQSLEELARTAMHRAAAGRRYHRIQVDVDDYRARRREALQKFAKDLAEQVADSGESKAMEPMGAADRKLIHDAVGEVPGVETVSEGRDPRRYIVILATNGSDEEE